MDDNDQKADPGAGFSPTPAIVGVAGLAIALWGLAGAPDVGDSAAIRWGAIGLAVIIGIALIVIGGLSGRHR